MINIREIKDMIINDALSIDLLIFICKDGDHYIANQYIDVISEKLGRNKRLLSNLSDLNRNSAVNFINDFSNDLNIYRVDTLNEDADFSSFDNTIIVCDKVDKKLSKKVEAYCIEVPKLVDWQIKDHCKVLCPNMSNVHLDWIYQATKGNIFRLDNELGKIALFDKEEANNLIIDLKNDIYSDLYDLSTFTFVDAVVKGDKIAVLEALSHKKCWDSDPMFILTLLLNKYKQILLIHGNSGLSAEDLKMSPKQFNAVKFYYKGFNLDSLRDKIDFLSGINLRINLGEFDCGTSDTFLDYLICNLM